MILGCLGCGHNQVVPIAFDAAPPPVDGTSVDADAFFCDAPLDSGHVTVVDAGVATTFARLHAGGTWLVGPVAPSATSAPMTVAMLFTDADHVPQEMANCCAFPGSGCCTLAGVAASTDGLASGTEVGTHPISFHGFQDQAFAIQGTLTITSFEQPFEHAPGHIAGSVSGTASGGSVTGSFDNTFCRALLTSTI